MAAPAILAALGVVAGIACSYKGFRADLIAPPAFLAALTGFLLAGKCSARTRGGLGAAAVLLAGVVCGGVFGYRHYRVFDADHIREIMPQERATAVIEGVIVEEPVFRSYQFLRWAAIRVELEALTVDGDRR